MSRANRVGFAFAALLLCAIGSGCAAERGTIGAVLSQSATGALVIHEAPEGLAAAKAGLRPGDQILLIDGRDARALPGEQLQRALAGQVGEPIKLTLVRGERVLRVTLQRTPARKLRSSGEGGG